MHVQLEHSEVLMRFSLHTSHQYINLKFLPDYQWFVALQRFSQTWVWLPMEELQPCEEVNGKQSEMFIIWISVTDFISICVKLMNLNYWILQLHGRKQHIRALLIDRVMLQHEVGCWARCIYLFLYIYITFLWYFPPPPPIAQKADNGGLSVQEYSPGSDERSVKTFH